LGEFINAVRRNGLAAIPRRPQQSGRYFTTPTLREWLAYRRRDAGAKPRAPGSTDVPHA
jgi:hypothetical protein